MNAFEELLTIDGPTSIRQALAQTHGEWRYVAGATHKHLVQQPEGWAAACGHAPWDPSDWRGTGSHDEARRLTGLRRCRDCHTIYAQGPTP